MTSERYLDAWRSAGTITGEQHAALSALVRRERISLATELNALLYLGVVVFAAGVAWTVRDHFANIGDAAIGASLTTLSACAFAYCALRARPYAREQVQAPTFAFDYVLYLGCLVFAVDVGYVEYRFRVLQTWDAYLLASAALYFVLAYRFDNRFVLSLALSTLAAWFGVRMSVGALLVDMSIRTTALTYGSVVVLAGVATDRAGIKRHFLETYLHVAANAILFACVSGVLAARGNWVWMFGLLVSAAVTTERGIRFRRFAFVVYGLVYAYAGISARVVELAGFGDTARLAYFVASATAVVAALVAVSRTVGREA